MSDRSLSLRDFGDTDPRQFVDAAYVSILGRAPTDAERKQMLDALLTGATRPLLLGTLRYSAEGRQRGIDVRGLHTRYLIQRVFQVPALGYALGWASALLRLPSTLRFFRGAHETQVLRQSLVHQQYIAEHASIAQQAADAGRRLANVDERLAASEHALVDTAHGLDDANRAAENASRMAADANRTAATLSQALADLQQLNSAQAAAFQRITSELAQALGAVSTNVGNAMFEARAVKELAERTRVRVDAIHPPPLSATLEMVGSPLADIARERAEIPPDAALDSLSPHKRYSLFESVFYDSATVAAKQRIYLDYVDRARALESGFIDLGCGRGELLHILRAAGIESVGVDINPEGLGQLRGEGFDVIEQDIVDYLESEQRVFGGAALLQVAEHLTASQLERVLTLVAKRLVPGAVLIVETPNPLSPFALGTFHTDPTHVDPIPPERMRYAIEAAGFERTLTLFQARIPEGQFAGPDPRAYYADYAIVGYRSSKPSPAV